MPPGRRHTIQPNKRDYDNEPETWRFVAYWIADTALNYLGLKGNGLGMDLILLVNYRLPHNILDDGIARQTEWKGVDLRLVLYDMCHIFTKRFQDAQVKMMEEDEGGGVIDIHNIGNNISQLNYHIQGLASVRLAWVLIDLVQLKLEGQTDLRNKKIPPYVFSIMGDRMVTTFIMYQTRTPLGIVSWTTVRKLRDVVKIFKRRLRERKETLKQTMDDLCLSYADPDLNPEKENVRGLLLSELREYRQQSYIRDFKYLVDTINCPALRNHYENEEAYYNALGVV